MKKLLITLTSLLSVIHAAEPTSTVLIDFSIWETEAGKNNYNAGTGWNKVEGNETPDNFRYPKEDATASNLKTTTGADSTITATFKAVSNSGFLSNSKGSYGEDDFNKMEDDELATTNNMWKLMHGSSISVTEALQTAWKEQGSSGYNGAVFYGDLVVNGLKASTQSIITEGTTTTTTITNRTYAVSLTVTASGSNFANHVAEGGVSLSGNGITVEKENSYITSHDGTLRFDDGGLNTEALKDTTFMTITWVFDAPVSEEDFGFTIQFDSSRDWGGELLIGALGITQFDNITVDQVTDQFEEDLGNTGGWNPGGENIPEPTTATLSLLALTGLAIRRRRK